MIFFPYRNFVKAQISVFILIGLVLVATISVGIYITGTIKSVENKNVQGLDSVESYVSACFQGLLESAVELSLAQGGSINPQNYLSFESRNIGYGIRRLSDDYTAGGFKVFYKSPPEFPWIDFPNTPGTSNLVDLTKKYKIGEVVLPSNDSVINDLKNYVSGKSTNCLNFDKFSSEGISVTATVPSFSIFLNPSDVQLVVDIIVEASKLGDVKKSDSFTLSVPVRLAGLLQAAFQIASDDAEIITFSPDGKETSVVIGGITQKFSSSVIRNPVSANRGDDIVEIRDSERPYRGDIVKFRFARQNRHPALVKTDLSFFDGKRFENGYKIFVQNAQITATGKYYVGSGVSTQTVTTPLNPITLYYHDPDEDVVNFGIVSNTPSTPAIQNTLTLITSTTKFSVVASDGDLYDYQERTVTVQ
ncbi:hypothetical protein HY483_01270 [Candidatus Woesearchaeota archaeon]|nr:hypothetical protein [Candidatus Woesearchaeota archaeon]